MIGEACERLIEKIQTGSDALLCCSVNEVSESFSSLFPASLEV
jgi:hypothetical protein